MRVPCTQKWCDEQVMMYASLGYEALVMMYAQQRVLRGFAGCSTVPNGLLRGFGRNLLFFFMVRRPRLE